MWLVDAFRQTPGHSHDLLLFLDANEFALRERTNFYHQAVSFVVANQATTKTLSRINKEQAMAIDMRGIARQIVQEYDLPLTGTHGITHWARVYDNGQRVAEASGADKDVVALFALFHDSKRRNEGYDPDHGQRGAEMAKRLRGDFFELSDSQFYLLIEACRGHTHCRLHDDVTIGACWDSDRLDLGRVGTMPHPHYLNTDEAKRKETIHWADGRASFNVIPDWITERWGIELPSLADGQY